MVDVSAIVPLISGATAAVGAVGGACLSVKALITAFKQFRQLGYSEKESMRMARAGVNPAETDGAFAQARQRSRDHGGE